MGKYSAVFSRKDEGKNLKVTNPAHNSMTNAAANNIKGCSETDQREKSCSPLTGRYKCAFKLHKINKQEQKITVVNSTVVNTLVGTV